MFLKRSIAFKIASSLWSEKKTPVLFSITVSSKPAFFKPITGVPQACASTGAMPKSSIPACTKALALLT